MLADAGTQGQIGPNLDDAFRQSRKDGLGETTIESVVRGQIAYPVEDPATGAPGMPADIVTGEDADSVAAYVASVAALPVRPQPGGTTDQARRRAGPTTGEGEAASRRPTARRSSPRPAAAAATRSTAAGASGTVGPNLDEAKPPKELVIERVTNGMGAMPAFKDSYSAEQIEAVADYVVANAAASSRP